jgi:hypothetical protein
LEIEERKKELSIIINRIDKILAGLTKNESFDLFLDDYKTQMKRIDETWQYIEDPKKLESMKIMKLATLSVINVIDIYKLDLQNAKLELAKLENPDVLVNKDYDSQ